MTIGAGFKVLLVEDNPESREAAIEALDRILVGCEVTWAADRDDALSKLAINRFDLAVCDLKLPARLNELATNEANGFAVISDLEQNHAGTPIIVLSAWASLDNTETHTSTAAVGPAFGVPQLPMCQVAVKGRPDDFEGRLKTIADGLEVWESIDIQSPAQSDQMLVRAIKHLATIRGYTSASIDRAAGLSGSLNAFATLYASGRLPMKVFVKIDSEHWISDEERRRREFVEGHLDPGNWPPTLEIQKVGLRDRAASFSSLSPATGFFGQLCAHPEKAEEMVRGIEETVADWVLDNDRTTTTIGDLRRIHLSTADADGLGIDLAEFEEFEQLSLTFSRNVVHGDLHGENVLVRPDLRPLLIDFAYTEVGLSVTDAVTLEMSLLFHPGTPLSRQYLSQVNYDRWALGAYFPDHIYQPFVDRCRAWALNGADEACFLAFAYAHALRQTKHENVDRDRVLQIARGIARRILDLTR